MSNLADNYVTIDLSFDELDALHSTLGISIKRLTKKFDGLPSTYRDAERVAADLRSLISIQQKVLEAMAESITDEVEVAR